MILVAYHGGPMTKLDYDLRYVDFSQLQQFMGRRLYLTNRGRYGAALVGVVLCALLITFAIVVNLYGSRHFQIFGTPYPRSTLILLILTLLGAILSLIPAVKIRLSILRSQVSDKGPLLGATSLYVEEDGITVSKSLVTTKYKWGAFQSVEIAKGAIILPIDSGMGIIIPGSAFKSDTERYAFVAEISKRIDVAKAGAADTP
jgi:hypothetical protein